MIPTRWCKPCGVLVAAMTECCLAEIPKCRVGNNDGPSEGRVGREVLSHDVVNVACKYNWNGRDNKRNEPSGVVEKPYRIADGPFRNGCLKQEKGSKGKGERAKHARGPRTGGKEMCPNDRRRKGEVSSYSKRINAHLDLAIGSAAPLAAKSTSCTSWIWGTSDVSS